MSDFPEPARIRLDDIVRALEYLQGRQVPEPQLARLHHRFLKDQKVQTYRGLIRYFSEEINEIAVGQRGDTNREFGARIVYLERCLKNSGNELHHEGALPDLEPFITDALERLPFRDGC